MNIKKALSFILACVLVCAVIPVFGVSAATVTWNANKVNVNSYTEKDAILFTAAFGKDTIPVASGRDYSWWRVIICDYDYESGVYKVISVNNTTGTGMSKTAVIPKNGFVIADCYSASFDGLVNVHVGDSAYLYTSTDGKTAKVTFGGKGTGTPHAPEKGIDMPKTNLEHLGITAATADGFKIKVQNYDKSVNYYITVNDASVCDDGVMKQTTRKLTSDTFELNKNFLKQSELFTLSLWAEKDGKYSPVVRTRLVVFGEKALQTELSSKTVVAFGDSLTAFTGWVKGMLTVIGTDVINSGVGGDTSAMGKARFKRDVLDKNPDICIINFGMNDQAEVVSTGKPNLALDAYTANIRYFITELQKIDCYVVLVTPHTPHNAENYYSPGQYGLDYTGAHMESFCNAVRNLAAEYNCGLVDINKMAKAEDMSKFTMMYDGVHCSEYGHSKYLEWISTHLLEKYAFAGDANGDGKVDENDAEIAADFVLSHDEHMECLDFNRNGRIDVNDYLYLKRYISGNGELRWEK